MDLSVGIILIVYAIVLIILGFLGYNFDGERETPSSDNKTKKVVPQV
jgi:hypothetical protein